MRPRQPGFSWRSWRLCERQIVGHDRERRGEADRRCRLSSPALHKKQLLTYLRLADKRLGLLINFNVVLIKDGITRIVNGLPE